MTFLLTPIARMLGRRPVAVVPTPAPVRGDGRDYPTLPLPVFNQRVLAAQAAAHLAEEAERLGWTATDALACGRMGGAGC